MELSPETSYSILQPMHGNSFVRHGRMRYLSPIVEELSEDQSLGSILLRTQSHHVRHSIEVLDTENLEPRLSQQSRPQITRSVSENRTQDFVGSRSHKLPPRPPPKESIRRSLLKKRYSDAKVHAYQQTLQRTHSAPPSTVTNNLYDGMSI